MSVARSPTEDFNSELKRAKTEIQPSLCFLDEDKIGTIQPYDDALVVTLRIGGAWCEEGNGGPGQLCRDHVP